MQMRNYMSKVKMTAMSLALITSILFIGTSCSDKDDLEIGRASCRERV